MGSRRSGPGRLLRRGGVLVVLAGVFAAGATAGVAIADRQAFDAALAGLSGSPRPAASHDGGGAVASPVPSPSAAPTAPPSPSAGPSPAATPTFTPSPSPTPVPSPTIARSFSAKLDRALATARKSLLLPGVEATVVFADGSSWTGVAGFADVQAGRPVTPETPFGIASITKTFTSALILRYVDRGLMSLDDRLSRWYPTWPNARRITVRMLLNHTSGIPDVLLDTKLLAALERDRKRAWTPDQILGVYGKGVLFPPGTGWGYSNTNYVLLGLITEQVGGAPWATLVRQELLDPLGLTETYVQVAEQPPGAAPARAYEVDAGSSGPVDKPRTDGTTVMPFTSVVSAAWSAGAMASTTADLTRWEQSLYGGNVLSPESRKALLTFVKSYPYGIASSYGLGVSRVTFQGRFAYGHTGALAGTRSSIRYFPKEGVAVAVLFNRDGLVGDDVVRILAKVLFPAAPKPSPPASPSSGGPPAP